MAFNLTHYKYSVFATTAALMSVSSDMAFAATDGGNAEVGLPQLNAATYSSQVFWLIISFILLYILMSKIALPRVSETLDIRNSNISGNLSRAEKFQSEMEDVKQQYETSLANAQTEAQKIVKKIEDKTSAKITEKNTVFAEDARARLIKSEATIASEKDKVLKSMEDIAADLTQNALKKVAGITVKKDAALKAVKTNMKELA